MSEFVKVHRVVLMIIDHEDLGDKAIQEEIEAVRWPNNCINPQVMQIDTTEVEWSRDHKLSRPGSLQDRAFANLFKDRK